MFRFGLKTALVAASAIALASPAAATTTVNATVTGFLAGTGTSTGSPPVPVPPSVRRTVITNSVSAVADVYASRMVATKNTNSSYPYPLLGGAGNSFVAFCIEPLELIPIGTEVAYKVVPLSQAASGLGGIGATKADYIRELFGRNAPDGGFAVMTPRLSAIFQVAIWEIVTEQPGTAFSLRDGNMRIGLLGVSGIFDRNDLATADLWLSRLSGDTQVISDSKAIAKAEGLFVLQNGTLGVQGSGTQDLLVFAAVPEPSSWAMLIAGFGLTGAAMRRRRDTATA